MKKIFINDLETEKRDELIKRNKKLLYLLYDGFRDMLYNQQEEASYDIMGKDWHKYVKANDHYDSFFLTLTDWRAFYENIDADYLSDDARSMYDTIGKKIKELDKTHCYDEKYDILEDEIEDGCLFILNDIEEYLHAYEDLPDDDEVIRYADEMEQLDEYYIEEHEDGFCDGVIRRDVSYTDTFI